MPNSHTRPGDFCWFELATTDQAGAKRFYESLFEWTSEDRPIGPADLYTIFRRGGGEVAAAYTMRDEQRSQGVPPNWLVYIAVEDADASAARVAALGGSVVAPPFDVMDQGRMAMIADPAGALFAIWQPKLHAGVAAVEDAGSIVWADLRVRDQVKAGAFYSSLFGWKMVEGRSMKPAVPGSYYHIVNGEKMIGGIPPAEQVDPHEHPSWLIYMGVADCVASTKKAAEIGGRPYVDTMSIGDEGRISVIADPQGAVFAIHESLRH